MDLVIQGGLVVDGQGIRRADIGIRAGKVAEVGPDLKFGGAEALDATGRYILPGAIDVHAHPVYLDDMGATSIAGAAGGVTTIIHFGYVRPGMAFMPTLQGFREQGEAKSVLDFGLHAGLFDVENQLAHIPEAFQMGITSYKVFMTYAKLKWMTDDYHMLAVMEVVKAHRGLVMVHCENGLATDYLEDKILREGRSTREAFIEMRPGLLEAEATYRAMCLAQVAGCPIYIVHVSAAPVLDHIRRAKRGGWPVLAETCPQYLTLSDQTTQELGPLAKIGPPLRTEADQQALWHGLANGTLDIVGSDHAPKDKGREDDFFEAAYGSPQIETMLSLLHDRGVNAGRITLPRLVQVTSENPARAFGLYPIKGALLVGSDADLVIIDPNRSVTIASDHQHSNASYSLYEGWGVLGRPSITMQRGQVIVEEGALRAKPGQGRYLSTSTEHLHAQIEEGA